MLCICFYIEYEVTKNKLEMAKAIDLEMTSTDHHLQRKYMFVKHDPFLKILSNKCCHGKRKFQTICKREKTLVLIHGSINK